MMPKKSGALASIVHEMCSAAPMTQWSEWTYWCVCSPKERSESALEIARHIQARTGQSILTGAEAVRAL